MPEQQYSWKTSDGLTIQGRHWPVANPKAVACLVHGLGEHCGRYAHVADFFGKNQIALIGYDRRGHGLSEGKRGDAPSFDALLDEVETLLQQAKTQYPDTPFFLYGHSLGGNLALSFLLRKKPDLQGMLATGPFIRLPKAPPMLQVMLGKLMQHILPSMLQPNGLVLEGISRDKAEVEKYLADPLVHNRISVRKGLFMLDAARTLDAFEGEMPVPALLMHGSADMLTSPAGTEDFAGRVGGDLSFKKWEGLYHEIHNEPEKAEVMQAMVDWIKSKS